MSKKCLLLFFFVFVFVEYGFSYTHVEGNVKVNSLWAYEDFGQGDIFIETTNGKFFINTNKPGGKNLYSMLLIAQQNQQSIEIWFNENIQWNGTGDVCHELYALRLVSVSQ